jgi:hypothetical protein
VDQQAVIHTHHRFHLAATRSPVHRYASGPVRTSLNHDCSPPKTTLRLINISD